MTALLLLFAVLTAASLALFAVKPSSRPAALVAGLGSFAGLVGTLLSASPALAGRPAEPGQTNRVGGLAPAKAIERQNPLPVGDKPPVTQSEAAAKKVSIASFGTGCFWCSEDDLRRTKGVLATAVGYQGGHVANPTYKQVCNGDTGHVEVTLFSFDPKVVSYRTLVQRFFEIHDPTQGNRQGPDVGVQYRSVIFTYTPEQAKIAKEVMDEVQKKLTKKITTTIEPAPVFWRAEDYHQQYYQKKGYNRDV